MTAKLLSLGRTLCVLSASLILTLTACRDEFQTSASEVPVEGQPAVLTLDVALDVSSTSLTRSFIDEAAANYCNDIWIGIYRESDGACTFNQVFTSVVDVNETEDHKYGLGRFSLPTESGRSYIVAVANATTRYGIANNQCSPTADKTRLSALLTAAKTWKEFLAISVLRSDKNSVAVFSPDLIYCGYYTEDPANVKSTELADIPTFDITPGHQTLTGVLYLRRLISYSKFYVRAGDNVTVEPTSWRVYNSAGCCYLFELNEVSADELDYYGTSDEMHSFGSEPDGSSSFEAYLLDNRESACDYAQRDGSYVGIRPDVSAAEQYADREREFKNADGTNSGIYRSLVANPADRSQASMHGNTATYVVITANVCYYVADTPENRSNPDMAEPEPYDASKAQIRRRGKAKYTVHLGYCYGKDADGNPTYETACDFNVRRNTRYTYNITIRGLKSIVVEALLGDETQPGAEGYVTDAYDSHITLDAHYGVFNISLSNLEREGLSYHVADPFGSQTVEFSSAGYQKKWDDLEFFTWVRFKPTSGEDVLAIYNDGTPDNDLWTLQDLADPARHPHTSGIVGLKDRTQQWYTVFVDEYVYHQDPDGSAPVGIEAETLWRNYVNRDNRVCELVVSGNTNSADGESFYSSSKYVIQQRAIQTYYKDIDDGLSTGVGVEHTNESYGLNMRWTDYRVDNGVRGPDYSAHNGRLNTLRCAMASTGGEGQWSRVVDFSALTHIDADANAETYHAHPSATYYVPALVRRGSGNHISGDPAPGDPDYYNPVLACMNRNRDLNGDGLITANEVKWYLPAYWGYVRIMAGQMELPSPLMSWDKYSETYFKNAGGLTGTNGRQDFHYITSDARYLWAEEGMSVGDGVYAQKEAYPYQLRCVRNLGTKIPSYDSWSSDTPEVGAAFEVNGNIISMTYYEDNCCRAATASFVPPHAINSTANRPARSFEVAADYCRKIEDDYGFCYTDEDGHLHAASTSPKNELQWIGVWANSLTRNTVCSKYKQEGDKGSEGVWRVPTQLELAFMQMCGFIASGENAVCSTHEYFVTYEDETVNRYRYFGISKGQMTRSPFQYLLDGQKILVRCVRDVN